LYTIETLLSKNGTAYIAVRNDIKALNGYTKRGTWQGRITLPLPCLVENSSFAIYKLSA
jgi:hypothetical protein